MRLLHHSREPLKAIRSVAQLKEPNYKPHGLWVSVEGEDDWRSWCEGNDFALDKFEVTTEIFLTPSANVLHLSTAHELDVFTKKHQVAMYPGQSSLRNHGAIDWHAVAGEFQGIIIAPYVWMRRMELMWYYGWDCASGCIWDAAAVRIGAARTEHPREAYKP